MEARAVCGKENMLVLMEMKRDCCKAVLFYRQALFQIFRIS